MTTKVFVAVVLALFASPVSAAEDMLIWGVGSVSCAKYAKIFKDAPDRTKGILIDWAQGYMSGLNSGLLSANKPTRNLSGEPENLASVVMAGCDQRPLALVVNIVQTYFDYLPLSNYRKPNQ